MYDVIAWLICIFKITRISLERKEIFEKTKQHFSSHAGHLSVFQNGLDANDRCDFRRSTTLMLTDFWWWQLCKHFNSSFIPLAQDIVCYNFPTQRHLKWGLWSLCEQCFQRKLCLARFPRVSFSSMDVRHKYCAFFHTQHFIEIKLHCPHYPVYWRMKQLYLPLSVVSALWSEK